MELIGIQWFVTGFMIPNNITRMKSPIESVINETSIDNPEIEVYSLIGEKIYLGYLNDNLRSKGVRSGVYLVKVNAQPVFYKKVMVSN